VRVFPSGFEHPVVFARAAGVLGDDAGGGFKAVIPKTDIPQKPDARFATFREAGKM
jgi:hypothetical protein